VPWRARAAQASLGATRGDTAPLHHAKINIESNGKSNSEEQQRRATA
jgi:hypothetical protein